ncbi:MAG: type II secretion system F family protein [Acidobacteriota bacterium]
MPTYHFRGRQYQTGGTIKGERFAQNKQALAAALRDEQIMPITIAEKSKPFQLPWQERVSLKDLALFTRQFSVMIDAGLPLVECLGILGEQQQNKALRNTLGQVRADVESGATLADAMRRHPKIFDRLFVNMIAAGETGGILDIILNRLSVFAEKNVKLKRAVVSASVYPAIIIAVAAVIVFVIMIWVIPVFATLFESLNAPLPLPTRIVMWSSNFLGQFILPIVIALGLLAAAGSYFYKSDQGRHTIDKILLHLPVVGILLKKIAISRFARTLSTLLMSGIAILEGLEITARTAGNAVIQRSILHARKVVEEGKTLVEPLKKSKVFPVMVTQIISVGEQTGRLDMMLEKLADYYEEEADTAIANFLTLLEPLMIVFLGTVIGGIVVSMYLPIFTLIGRLAGG